MRIPILAALALLAQSPLSFEVASVKPASAPIATKDAYSEGYNAGMRAALSAQGLRVVGQRVSVTDNTLRDLIRLAYQVKEYQIAGPPWIAVEKYEIAAIMPAGATRAQAPEMLRTLLEQRFHLAVHREKRKMAAYALVAAKSGPKLTIAAPNSRSWAVFAGANTGRLRATASPVSAFADLLSKAADRPVVDMTGLTGSYDFDLTYAPELNATGESGPPLEIALQNQLGLKLEKRDMEIELLVVDRADKVPVGN
jgi:uncharacterized protein (TIGR03435 family)